MTKAAFTLDSESGELKSYVYEPGVGAIVADIKIETEFLKPGIVYTADVQPDGQLTNVQEQPKK